MKRKIRIVSHLFEPGYNRNQLLSNEKSLAVYTDGVFYRDKTTRIYIISNIESFSKCPGMSRDVQAAFVIYYNQQKAMEAHPDRWAFI